MGLGLELGLVLGGAVDLAVRVRYRLVRRRASWVGGGPAGQAGRHPVAEAGHDGARRQPAQ